MAFDRDIVDGRVEVAWQPAELNRQLAAASANTPRLLKPKDVAGWLDVSKRTLERWRITRGGASLPEPLPRNRSIHR